MTLSEILQKIGVKQYEDLTADEKATYHQMEETFKEEMTIERLKDYIDSELKNLLVEIANPDNVFEKEFYLKARIRDLTALSFFIDSPKLAKDKLEAYLRKVGVNKQI